MRERLLQISLAAVAVLVPGLATADALAGARLTRFGYTLIDLNPGDGIAPALTLDVMGSFASVRASVEEGPMGDAGKPPFGMVSRELGWSSPFVLFPQVARDVAMPLSSGSASLAGAVEDHSFSAATRAVAGNTLEDRLLASRVITRSFAGAAMTLTPFTQVVWNGVLDLETQTTLGRRGLRTEVASASASVWLKDSAGTEMDSFSTELHVGPYAKDLKQQSFDVGLSWANASAASVTGQVAANLSLLSYSFLPVPVPEPGAPWLMLCGLGAIAAVHRRRGRAA